MKGWGSTGHRWIPLTKDRWSSVLMFLLLLLYCNVLAPMYRWTFVYWYEQSHIFYLVITVTGCIVIPGCFQYWPDSDNVKITLLWYNVLPRIISFQRPAMLSNMAWCLLASAETTNMSPYLKAFRATPAPSSCQVTATQQHCRDACEISERYDHYNIKYCVFEILRVWAVRRLAA